MRLILRPVIAAVFAFLAGMTHANASAGVSCTAADASAELEIEAAFTRGLGGGIINFSADLEVLLPNTPRDFRKSAFKRKDVSQVWWYGPEFRLQIYRERLDKLPYGSINVVIDAKMGTADDDEGTYRGTYKIEISYREKKSDVEPKTLTGEGKVECIAG